MGLAELGDTLDIHMGGEDLIFPHHEDEIAQSEALTGKPFVRWWVHVKHLRIDDRKMAKSLGNFIVLKDLLDEGYRPAAIRHQLLSAHYRAELNFTLEGLDGSARAVQRLLDFERRLEDLTVEPGAPPCGLDALAREALTDFRAAMDRDLNSADALAAAFVLVGKANALLDRVPSVPAEDRDSALEALRSMDRVLGILEVAHRGGTLDAETAKWVEDLIDERNRARASRDFQRADTIRTQLLDQGIALEDTPGGTRWKVVHSVQEA
jgi:cysteinyl-tRNA synthetase